MEDRVPSDLRPYVMAKQLGTTAPGKLDEFLKLASEIYK